MKKSLISIIAAIGDGHLHNRVLGKNNELLWHIPDDLKRFKTITRGHPVIMGRKTFESIVVAIGKPLPERTNIVITRDTAYQGRASTETVDNSRGPTSTATSTDSVLIVHSLDDALAAAAQIDTEEVFVIGGGEIYAQALPYVDRLYLTLIEDDKEGDSYFPAYEDEFTIKTLDEAHEWEGLKYRWVNLERAT